MDRQCGQAEGTGTRAHGISFKLMVIRLEWVSGQGSKPPFQAIFVSTRSPETCKHECTQFATEGTVGG